MQIKITFLGAAQNVTGSRYLIEANGFKFLVDCGLFQEHDLKVRDWVPFPANPHSIDAVLLTHAHLDHAVIYRSWSKKVSIKRFTAPAPRKILPV